MSTPIPTDMTGSSSNSNADTRRAANKLLGWLLFPLSLFPLVALLTYDWHAIPSLQLPPAHTSNWIGAVGDYFAYYGYLLVGFAIWVVPVICILSGLLKLFGKRLGTGYRKLFIILFTFAVACLLQVVETHVPAIGRMLVSANTPNAGGAVGYLMMNRFLSPLLSDFGASVIMLVVMVFSVIATIGLRNLGRLLKDVYYWAMLGGNVSSPSETPSGYEPAAIPEDPREAQLRAIREAREAAKLEKEREKARMIQEKEAEKQAMRAAREAAKIAAREARETAKVNRLSRPAPAKEPVAGEGVPDKGPYILPPMDLLSPLKKSVADHSDIGITGQRLIDTLKLFGVDATLAYNIAGPVVTKYAVELKPGTRYTTVTSLSDNLMGALHAKSLRIEAPIPGEDKVGIEVPNTKPASVSFREIFEGSTFRNCGYELPLLFGKDAAGNDLVADLAAMPHMLVAGATGQGKSVCLNSIINGLLMTRTPEQLKLIMVDPKSVEFGSYERIPHLLVPVITDNRKVMYSLAWAVAEMEKRLKLFSRAKVRNIKDFNSRKMYAQPDMFGADESAVGGDMPKTVPYIVIIIDEVADLMQAAGKEVTPHIARLTAKARAAGIHLILATQRPDAKIINGTIKSNIPARVAFKTSSSIDSRTILDDTGAENLIGRGDMLFRTKDGLLIRAQGAWISDAEINRITAFIEEHSNTQFDEKFATKLGRVKEAGIEDPFASNEDDPDNQPGGGESGNNAEAAKAAAADELFSKAIEVILSTKRASISHFQRHLGIGYNNAAKLCDRLEAAGVIAAQTSAGPRTILMSPEEMSALTGKNGATVEEEAPAGNADANPAGNGFYMTEDDLFAENKED